MQDKLLCLLSFRFGYCYAGAQLDAAWRVSSNFSTRSLSNPGCSISDISSALGATSKDLRLPVQKLLADGAIKTTGQKRGTRYHPGGTKPRATKKKAAKKKAGAKKKRAARK